jgi:hypothetical protein
VQATVPTASEQEVRYIVDKLYPAPSGDTPYSDTYGRAVLFTGDLIIECTDYALEKAYNNQPYGYEFSVSPAYHTLDLPCMLVSILFSHQHVLTLLSCV